MKHLYALLVGINQYPKAPLQACTHDVDSLHQLLSSRPGIVYHPLILLNKQATKTAIVAAFRTHLAQAGAQDSALFYFAGHGSREPAAPEWRAMGIEQLNNIVCFEAGHPADALLADKELRFLIHTLFQQTGGAHLVTLFDCCHSGDNTRNDYRKRYQPEVGSARSWNSFIFKDQISPDEMLRYGLSAVLPEAPHISLSACASDQSAGENNGHGLFTKALTDTLNAHDPWPTYQQLAEETAARLSEFGGQQPQIYTPVAQRSDLDVLHTRFLLGTSSDEAVSPIESSLLPFTYRPVSIWVPDNSGVWGDVLKGNKMIARATSPDSADYALSFEKNTCLLHRPGTPQWPLIQPWNTTSEQDQRHFQRELWAVARWHQWLQWPPSDDFPFKIVVEDTSGPLTPDASGTYPLVYHSPESSITLSIRLEYVGTEPVYLSCLLLNKSFGVQPELLSPIQRRVTMGQTVWLMEGYGRKLKIVPDQVAVAFQWPFYTEYLLFIAGAQPFPAARVSQPDLPLPMPDTAERAATRDVGLENAPPVEMKGWVAQRLNFLFLKK